MIGEGVEEEDGNDDNSESSNTEIPTLEGLEDAATIFPRTVAKRGRRGLPSLTKRVNASHKTHKSASTNASNN